MRIWKGIDVEHNDNHGKLTLFVESSNPDIEIVDRIMKENKDIEAIYFGAGEVDVLRFEFIKGLSQLKTNYGVLLLLECGYENVVTGAIRSYFDFVILRIRITSITENEEIKIRTDDTVYISDIGKFKNNSLTTLHDGQYEGDIELYKET